jgi:hypothetical protein
MHRRLFGSILFALTLAGSYHVTVAAAQLYVVCRTPDSIDTFIQVSGFSSVGAAVKHCVQFWKGAPQGFTLF